MPNEMTAWLGPAADQLTAYQLEIACAEQARVQQRYPHPDQTQEREAALSAVVQLMLGDTTPEAVGRALIDARMAEVRAFAAAEAVAVALVRHGEPKATAARRAGIDRMSLLKALGER